MNRKWQDYYMGFASHAATASKDTTQVGAALIGPDGEVRLTGFNGPARGVEDRPERFIRPEKYLYASHAEQNMIDFAAREGIRTKGCSIFSTHQPCAACARSIIQAGIVRVYYKTAAFPQGSAILHEIAAARQMFSEAGVICERIGGDE
ncbi:deaminase [Ochrobactrum sp. GPK 3]